MEADIPETRMTRKGLLRFGSPVLGAPPYPGSTARTRIEMGTQYYYDPARFYGTFCFCVEEEGYAEKTVAGGGIIE